MHIAASGLVNDDAGSPFHPVAQIHALQAPIAPLLGWQRGSGDGCGVAFAYCPTARGRGWAENYQERLNSTRQA